MQAIAAVPTGIIDPVSTNNNAGKSLTVGCADLAVNKQQSSANPTVGAPQSYTITVSNSSPGVNAAGVVFSAPLPEGFQYDDTGTCSVASGTAVCGPLVYDPVTRTVSSVITALQRDSSVRFTLNGIVTKPGSWRNTATISTTGTTVGDPLPASNTSTVNLSAAGVDLYIEKIGPTLYTPSSPISYTLTVKGFGDPVDGALIEDNVPASITGVTWTCSASNGATCGTASGSGNAISLTGDVQQGGSNSGSLTITIQGTVAAATTGNLVNTATVTPPVPLIDVNPGRQHRHAHQQRT